jgi:regulatory protein
MGTFRRKRAGDPEKAAAKARDPDAARLSALTLLARRDYASGELRQKLEASGYETGVVAAVLEMLMEERALNDPRYAENYVAAHAGRGQGPIRIAADLRALGIAADVIQEALASGPDWRVLARQVRARKFGDPPPEEWTEKTRQARFLQYRGFSSAHIRTATGADFDPDS